MIQKLELILIKAYFEMKAEASRGYIGFVWWIIEPVLYMGAFYFVFGVLFPPRLPDKDYVAFLLVGLTAWKWFASSLAVGSSSLFLNTGIVRQVYVPKYIFPASTAVGGAIKFSFVFLVLLVFLLVRGYYPTHDWIFLPIVLLIQFIFILGLSYILSAITPFFPDLRNILENILLFLFFLSGVIFDIDKTGGYVSALMVNPMAELLDIYRTILLNRGAVNLNQLVWLGGEGVVAVVFGLYILKRYDRVYSKMMY